MMLQRGVDVFPEAKGLPIFCHGCKNIHYAEETVSVSEFRQQEDGKVCLVQFLACFDCVLKNTLPEKVPDGTLVD